MTVDEELFFQKKMSLSTILYIPSKPGKYGMKIWVVCKANTFYGWKIQVYTGKNATVVTEVNQGSRVVKNLVKKKPKTLEET